MQGKGFRKIQRDKRSAHTRPPGRDLTFFKKPTIRLIHPQVHSFTNQRDP